MLLCETGQQCVNEVVARWSQHSVDERCEDLALLRPIEMRCHFLFHASRCEQAALNIWQTQQVLRFLGSLRLELKHANEWIYRALQSLLLSSGGGA